MTTRRIALLATVLFVAACSVNVGAGGSRGTTPESATGADEYPPDQADEVRKRLWARWEQCFGPEEATNENVVDLDAEEASGAPIVAPKSAVNPAELRECFKSAPRIAGEPRWCAAFPQAIPGRPTSGSWHERAVEELIEEMLGDFRAPEAVASRELPAGERAAARRRLLERRAQMLERNRYMTARYYSSACMVELGKALVETDSAYGAALEQLDSARAESELDR